MWPYRELIINLALSDLKSRYQNTTLGFFWSILSPLLLSAVLFFVFRSVFRQEETFLLDLLVGMMAWRFFLVSTNASLSAIVGKPSLVTKVYIPRQILVLSGALANLIGSCLEFVILLPIIFIVLGTVPVTALLFPFIHLFYFWLIFGVGLLLASLYVYLRDLNQIWDVLLNVLFFSCPIVYPLSVVSERLMPYYLLNPITNLIEMFRDVMIRGALPRLENLAVVIGFGAAIFLIGSYVFDRLQQRFAEEI
jgi:lipopolysaccharide transport system permease protein